MIKATPAPKPNNTQLAFIANIYGAALLILAVAQLIAFNQFAIYVSDFLNDSMAGVATTVAAIFVGMELFAVPFLFQLPLSRLARICSATLALGVPVAWTAIMLAGETFMFGELLIDLGAIIIGGISFWLLNGPKIMQLRVK